MANPTGPTFTLEIAALDREPVRLEVTEAAFPGTNGVFTVLPGHAAMVASITVGVLAVVLPDGKRHSFAVSGGMVHVLNNRVQVLTQTVEKDAEIDLERAEAARARAERELAKSMDQADLARAEVALKRAISRIRAKGGWGAGAAH